MYSVQNIYNRSKLIHSRATFKCIDSTQACLAGYIDGDCASTTCNGASGGEGSGAEGEFVTTQASPGNKIVAVGKDWSGEKVIVPGKTWNGKRFIQAGEDFKGNVVDVGRGLKGERRFVKVGEDFKEVGSGKRFVRVGEDFKSDIVDVGKSFVEDKRFVKVGEDFKSDVVDVGKDWEGED